jgi:hypothetical protein
MNKKFWVRKIVGIIVCVAAVGALLTYVVMSLWNNVLAVVLNISTVTYWQALGILVLSKILFGGFRKGGWSSHRGGHWRKEWQEKWEAKMQGMTPEEREKIKQEWRSRCRVWGKPNNEPEAGAE